MLKSMTQAATPTARVLALMGRYRREMVVVVVYAAAVGLFALATPLAVQVLINTIAFGGITQPLVVVALMLAAALGLSAAFQALQTVVVEMLSRRLFVETVVRFTRSLTRISGFDRRKTPLGVLTNRFYDVVSVEKSLYSWLFDGVAALLQIPLGLTLLALYHPFLLVFGGGVAVGTLFVTLVLGRGAARTAIKESTRKHELVAHLEELSDGSLFVSSRGREAALGTVTGFADSWIDAREKHFRVVFRQMIGFWGLQVLASASLLLVGGGLVISGQLTLGQLVAAELVMALTVGSLSKLNKQLPKLYDIVAALEKLAQVEELTPEVDKHQKGSVVAGPLGFDVSDLPLLHGETEVGAPASFSVSPAHDFHISGTHDQLRALVDVLQGFAPVAGGRVHIGGRALELWNPGDLRDRVVVLSTHWLAGRSLFDQVRVLTPDASDAEVHDALKRVGLEELAVAAERRGEAAINPANLPCETRMAVSVARAFLCQAGTVICPPMFDALAPQTRARLEAVLCDRAATWTRIFLHTSPQESRADHLKWPEHKALPEVGA